MSVRERLARIKSETSGLSERVKELRDLYESGVIDRDLYLEARFEAEVAHSCKTTELVREAFAPERPSRRRREK
ncbi:MAG: hypothetical protein NZ733_00240 [Aigarchaeota archaeon]|nr:hypothetical protein [Aigarchaeota archaeon]MCX8202911.1 hypothetical protein [Nitrososphaeria archaeon]MDW8043810.1 hypothetical protein [Nitrososphaerota archaeon]